MADCRKETVLAVDPEMDNEISHARTVCLGTSVIVREILQNLSNRELIKLTLVNKQWNYEARSVLRDRGTLKVRSRSSAPACQALGAFASKLHDMRVVPFSGMSLNLFRHHCQLASTGEGSVHPMYDVILKRLPFKKLKVELPCRWEKCDNCAALQFVKQILKDFGGDLEELSLAIDWCRVEAVRPHLLELFENCTFPRLKTLELDADDTHPFFQSFVKTLVTLAPNLRELRTRDHIKFNENVLEGSSAVLVPDYRGFNPLYEPVCESLIGAIRATKIEILRLPHEDFNPELLNRLIPMILHASRTTLTTLRIDLLFALPLMCYGICLENVTTLEIHPNDLEHLPHGLSQILKRFDFTRVFPKLARVDIQNGHPPFFSPAQIRAFVRQGRSALKKTLSDRRAINIKQLTLLTSVSKSTVSFLAQMLPDLETLTVYIRINTHKIPFTYIWCRFKHLKQLEVVHTGWRHTMGNLDSVFCGIFSEEVAELREQDDEYLKTVNIVPVMPSIRCMRELKTFTFCYNPQSHRSEVRDPNFLFSKVMGFVGFTRCPDLTVKFETANRQHCPEALCHMKPFASLTTVNFEIDSFVVATSSLIETR